MAVCIRAEALSKTYRRLTGGRGPFSLFHRTVEKVDALTDATFRVGEGELVGLIGPNGAGKSTTVKLLTGILTPTSGSCEAAGFVPWQDRKNYVRCIGTVFGQRTQLWWDVPIMESYTLLRDIYRLDAAEWKKRLDELSSALDLGSFLNTPLRQLSLGQRMRAELCASLLHRPKLLFLDEPSIGLDAVSKISLRAFLKEENREKGTTVLLTTHDMEDILALCPRVMVLGHGKLLYDGAVEALLGRYRSMQRLRIVFDGATQAPRFPEGVRSAPDGDAWTVSWDPALIPVSRVLESALAARGIREMKLEEENVDELIARMYREMKL